MTGRLPLLSLAAVLLVTACGGSSAPVTGNGASTTSSSAPPTQSSDADANTEGDVGTGGGDIVEQGEQLLGEYSGDGGAATITIGDETWEFTFYDSVPIASCNPDFFGGFLAVLTSGDDITAPFDQVMITLPGGDFTDPPEITVNLKVDEQAEWIADETIYERSPDFPPGIGVTSFTIDGQSAAGAATFYEKNSAYGAGDLVMADGTFQVTCGAE